MEKIYRPPSLGGIFFCFFGRCARARGCGKYPSAVRRGRTRGNACGAGFGEGLAAGNCSKKAIFLQLGIKTARRARKLGVLGIHKTNYVVKTTEFAERPRGMRRNGVFWGFTKRIPLLKQRNWRGNRAPCAETGCFGESQNELRCKNNGIGEETARRAR